MGKNCYAWLIQCPATDCNFTSALKEASDEELQDARVHFIAHPFANKTRRTAVEREIRRRAKIKG